MTRRKITEHESKTAYFEPNDSGRYAFVQHGTKQETFVDVDGSTKQRTVPCIVEIYANGWEMGMPKFGAPSGFGMGQHDQPRSIDDIWDFSVNAALSASILILEKGLFAWNGLRRNGAPDPNPGVHFDRAVFQRETVRRYNGGGEFRWDKTKKTWVIKVPSNPRQGYTNMLIGRPNGARVVYAADGTAPFGPNNYGDFTDEVP